MYRWTDIQLPLFLQESGKKRAKKDPTAPKKPMTAYMLWMQDYRPILKQKNPGASVAEIAKMAGEVWKELDAEEKAVSI